MRADGLGDMGEIELDGSWAASAARLGVDEQRAVLRRQPRNASLLELRGTTASSADKPSDAATDRAAAIACVISALPSPNRGMDGPESRLVNGATFKPERCLPAIEPMFEKPNRH